MNAVRNITASGNHSHKPRHNTVNEDHLELVERINTSLREEEAAGTPIDHEMIEEFERKLKELREKASD